MEEIVNLKNEIDKKEKKLKKQKEWLEYSKLDAKTSKRFGAPVRGAGLKIAGLVAMMLGIILVVPAIAFWYTALALPLGIAGVSSFALGTSGIVGGNILEKNFDKTISKCEKEVEELNDEIESLKHKLAEFESDSKKVGEVEEKKETEDVRELEEDKKFTKKKTFGKEKSKSQEEVGKEL